MILTYIVKGKARYTIGQTPYELSQGALVRLSEGVGKARLHLRGSSDELLFRELHAEKHGGSKSGHSVSPCKRHRLKK
ncbi:MAG: hypothetical protein LBK73_07040 [Treponema sp.]|jgi:hypothetical protein|nr:hypothetical protein [Treponema sp.]